MILVYFLFFFYQKHLSVDESMIQFKGRSSLKQYNPMKPIKRGYILWCIADNSAYASGFEVYTGKHKEKECQPNVDRRLGSKFVVS